MSWFVPLCVPKLLVCVLLSHDDSSMNLSRSVRETRRSQVAKDSAYLERVRRLESEMERVSSGLALVSQASLIATMVAYFWLSPRGAVAGVALCARFSTLLLLLAVFGVVVAHSRSLRQHCRPGAWSVPALRSAILREC